ncbi:RNA polymerase sigma factor [Photobacterium sp. WH77]|uniref:RNA polymerase sigma factor n=1 Tax=unclassified Photobacterium TaxID=2628852 RepID=UPI001EDA347F|nr:MULTISPECIES: RNA polymerase sigma factor [unclassified Photobacterium]MCG2838994.1 RNA polymerase sigma factor [Photobacterium sp. WH77]MCG2846654.1 RNA polymerase sigma factor [Photobacterium sp. WH80]
MKSPVTSQAVQSNIENLYRNEARKVYASLIRLLGDFNLAEEALHDAFSTALTQWPKEGIPDNPSAWLVSVGRFKAIDHLRRQKRQVEIVSELFDALNDTSFIRTDTENPFELDDQVIEDDQLRLIFTCCHPAIDAKVQVALTLREVCGLTTEEIASAFLTSPSTMAQRIVRGKAKIREANIPFQLPSKTELPDRIESVLSVIYLVYNEGYSASAGERVTRSELTAEAIRLARLVRSLLPDAEVSGLLALMLLNESRRGARTDQQGDIVLLEDQDRRLWDAVLIQEGIALVQSALETRNIGYYTLQAAIAAVHAQAADMASTDWAQIVSLYSLLLQVAPSPVIELNRAVAVAMRDGPQAGIEIVENLLEQKVLQTYHLTYATYGELLSRAGRVQEAISAFEHALSLVQQAPEQRILRRKLALLTTP